MDKVNAAVTRCQHDTHYDDCSICSGAQADFARTCYLLAEDWFDGESFDINCEGPDA